MTDNVRMLSRAIGEEPDDVGAIAALTDALIEECHLDRFDAESCVEYERTRSRETKDMERLATLIVSKDPRALQLVGLINAAAGLGIFGRYPVEFIHGDDAPKWVYNSPDAKERGEPWSKLIVGVRWALYTMDTIP